MSSILFFLILIPAVEIYLFIKIGSNIGAFTTIFLIFSTAIIGVYYAKYEGLNTLRAGFSQISKNQTPTYEVVSGAAIALAAVLLIIPGFLTDLIGFLLLIPISRNFLFKITIGNKKFKNINETTQKENKTIDGEIIDKNKDEL